MTDGERIPTITELIDTHHALLYRYAYRLSGSAVDAEDLTQQTYLIAHQNLHQLRKASSAKSWLCTILRHAYLRFQRTRAALVPLGQILEPGQRQSEPDFDEEALQQALCELTEDYRSAVILYYFQELSYKEIAEVLDVPLGTVMSRLSRGKAQLKELLERQALQDSARKSQGHVDRLRLVPTFPG